MSSSPSRRTMEIALGALFLGSLAILAYLALRMGSLAGFGDVVKVTVRLEDAAGLVEDASVKVAGVEVGRVTHLDVDFDSAILTVQIHEDAGIRKDAVAKVRARSLLGEKYLDIAPSSRTAPPIESGDELIADESGMAIEELASALGPQLDKLDLEKLSDGVLSALDLLEDQRDPIEEALARINRILKEVESLPLDDKDMHRDVKKLLSNMRLASEDLPTLLSDASNVIVQVKESLDKIQPTLDRVDEAAENLPQLTAKAEESLERVNSLLVSLEPQIKRLEDLNYSLLRYALREEGLLIRLNPQDVPQFDPGMSEIEWRLFSDRMSHENHVESVLEVGGNTSVEPPPETNKKVPPLPLFGLGDEDKTGEIPELLP